MEAKAQVLEARIRLQEAEAKFELHKRDLKEAIAAHLETVQRESTLSLNSL